MLNWTLTQTDYDILRLVHSEWNGIEWLATIEFIVCLNYCAHNKFLMDLWEEKKTQNQFINCKWKIIYWECGDDFLNFISNSVGV